MELFAHLCASIFSRNFRSDLGKFKISQKVSFKNYTNFFTNFGKSHLNDLEYAVKNYFEK
jgi:hypothetical protein